VFINGKPIDRKQPKDGEPKKRFDEKSKKWEFWCGRCQFWNLHDTERHRAMDAESAKYANDEEKTVQTSNTSSSNGSNSSESSHFAAQRLVPRFGSAAL
jgi:hypothetical protein